MTKDTFFPVSITLKKFHSHISFIYYRLYTLLATDSVALSTTKSYILTIVNNVGCAVLAVVFRLGLTNISEAGKGLRFTASAPYNRCLLVEC
jgi:hypothetical protein